MARLYRPYTPIEVKCRVLLRQLGEMWIDDVIMEGAEQRVRGGFKTLLSILSRRLASLLGCEVKDLRLDHDPPLALREKWIVRGKSERWAYNPDANDPEFLIYRSASNHDIKTRVRGDGAQFSDLALIRRQKKRNRPPKPKRPWPKRPFPKRASP